MNTEKALQLLNSKIGEIDGVHSPDDFLSWRDSTVQRLQVICPGSPIIDQIARMRPTSVYNSTNLVPKIKPQVSKMLVSLVEDIEVAGIESFHRPEKDISTNTVNVHNSNSQSQSQEQEQEQEVSLNFEYVVECLKKGLRDTEVEELKEILEAEEDPKTKKKKFSEKLMSFGSDVASNILANILTNPQVYEQLGGML
jgi:hypothetical protein